MTSHEKALLNDNVDFFNSVDWSGNQQPNLTEPMKNS